MTNEIQKLELRNPCISQFSISLVISHFSILKSIGHWSVDISDQ